LKRLGKILHLSKSRSLILKLESDAIPKLGSQVWDSKLKQVGVVYDIFGPTSAPYIAVRPTIPEPSTCVGKILYLAQEH